MPTAGRDVDIVLSHPDGSTNRVALPLWKDHPDLPGGIAVDHVSPAAPRQVSDEANYQQQHPDLGLVFDQANWGFGFGEFREQFSRTSLQRYAYTEGALAQFSGEIIPSYQEDEVDVLVRNGRFEWGATTGWTGTNATLAASTVSPRTGIYACRVTVNANNGTLNQAYGGTVSVAQSREVTLIAYARRISGAGTALARLTDSAGSTDSSTTAGATYSLLQVTRTIDAAATSLTFTILFSTSADVWDIDDIAVIPTGGVTFQEPVEYGGSVYAPCGRMIVLWNESDDAFYPVYWDASVVIVDLESFSGALYAARGTTTNYLRSTNGTTWANPATNTGNARLAEFFARTLNENGDWALMKGRANQISLSTDPSDTANWGAEIQAGDSDRATTNLIPGMDIVYVGREDSLMVYDRSIAVFRDVAPEAHLFPTPDNFAAAVERGGVLYASGGEQSLWKITPSEPGGAAHTFEDLSFLLKAPLYRGFGGRVSALAADRAGIWVGLADDLSSSQNEFPYDFPFDFASSGASNKIYLLQLKSQHDLESTLRDLRDILTPHTVTSFPISTLGALYRFNDGTQSSLFVLGGATNSNVTILDTTEPRVIRLRLPLTNENPRQNATIALRRTGKFFTPWVDFLFPDVSKRAAKLTLTSRNFTATNFVTVYYKTDDDTDDDSTGWTLWGDDGVFDTSPSETKASILTTPVDFRRIRFRVDFTSSSATAQPPTIVGLVFHAIWAPVEFRHWTAAIRLSDRRQQQLRRVPQRVLRSTDLSNLNTLREQAFVLFTDRDGSQYHVKLKYRQTAISSRVNPRSGVAQAHTDALVLDMLEVKTS